MSKKPDSTSNAGRFAIGAAVTALIGYIAGILTAPKSGRETREDIRDKAVETYSAAEKELKKLHTELNDVIGEVSDKLSNLRDAHGKSFDDAIQKGKTAKEKARELLSNLHDGDVDDKELKKAIADATKAVENLRNYLKK